MEILAKPWNGLLIAALAGGPARFSELLERLSSIGDRMLSERLKDLQRAGLVQRHVLPGPPVRVEYELTAAGHGFREVYDAIGRWGQKLGLATPEGE
jgi:DNA-binding HxlR family transcriptional regulator